MKKYWVKIGYHEYNAIGFAIFGILFALAVIGVAALAKIGWSLV